MSHLTAADLEAAADQRREQAAQCLRNAAAAGRSNDLKRVHHWRAQAQKYADQAEALAGVYAE